MLIVMLMYGLSGGHQSHSARLPEKAKEVKRWLPAHKDRLLDLAQFLAR
jgi:hypothetical protein